MYNVKDNSETKLQFGISSVATSLVVEEGTGTVFPTPPFIAVLNRRNEDGSILKSEKIEVTAIDGDQLTITRGFDGSESTDFNAGDYISLFVMAKHIQELQSALTEIQRDISEEGLVKPATDSSSGTVKIASNEIVNNVVNKDERGIYYVPKVSDLVPEYIGSVFISASDISIGADTYIHNQPDISECTKEFYIGKEENNKILDLQGLSNGRSFDSVSLKLDKGGLPTTKLVVEVMSASKNGNYWSGETVLATGELEASSITEVGSYTVALDRTVNLGIGTPFVVRLRQTNNIVNVMNYFIVYGHPTKNSDIFSGNYVIGNTISNTGNDIYFSCLGKLNQAIRQNTNGRIVHNDSYTKYSAEVVASGFSYPFNISSPDIDPDQPISISGTIQFVQHSNNGATLYSSSDAQGWMSYLGVDSNKVRDISANGRTYTITLNNKTVSYSDLANGVISIIGQASLSTWDHRRSECYFTISWNLTINFTDLNSGGTVQAVYIRNNAKRLGLVSATLVGKHIDGSFIYPRNDGSHAVIAGQKGDDGRRVILKVEDKYFLYKYDGDSNRTKLSEYYDFIGPEGPRGLQGPRGPMGGINYRGKLTSVADLPDEGTIEGEAYSVGGVLYIWDGEYFRNSGISSSSINLVVDWDNIENKPDYVRLSDEVAYQISQGNYDYVWRLTERLYTQINLLAKDLNLTEGEDIRELADLWYGKLISHDYLYNSYIATSNYALTVINRNDTNYLFNFTEGLDTQIGYIDSSLGIENVDDIEELADTYYGKVISNDNFYTNYIAKSSVALGYINRNNTDYLFQLSDLFYTNLNYIDSSFNFVDGDTFAEMLELPGEMAKFFNSALLRNSYFAKSSYAKTTYGALAESKVVKILLACLGEDISTYSTYSSFFGDGSLMDEVLSNSGCLNAICNNESAYTAMCSSSTAMNKIKASSTAVGVLCSYPAVMTKVWATTTSRSVLLGDQSAMDIILKNDNGSSSLAASSTALTAVSQSLTYIQNVFRNQADMKQALYTAFQPYSYKMYTTLNTNSTGTKYYTSDRDRSECGSKIEFRNTYYSFGETAVIFPAYYWDDGDSRSQQLRSQRFGVNVGYPHSSYANQQNIDILAMSSDSKPMGFALKGCSAVNLGGSNNGIGVIVFTL